jgi:hypothetical protein
VLPIGHAVGSSLSQHSLSRECVLIGRQRQAGAVRCCELPLEWRLDQNATVLVRIRVELVPLR